LILAHDLPLPDRIFTPLPGRGRYAHLSAEIAYQSLHELLKRNSTFTLVKDQVYVTFLHSGGDEPSHAGHSATAPTYFYMIRVSVELPSVILRLAFLGGLPGWRRAEVMADLMALMSSLRIARETQYVRSSEAAALSAEYSPSYQNCFSRITESSLLMLVRKPMERVLVRYR